MIIRVPVAGKPQIGQKQELKVVGLVESVEQDSANGQWIATATVDDVLEDSKKDVFPPSKPDRKITLRREVCEMRRL